MHTAKDFHDAQTTHSVFPCTGSRCTRRFFQYVLYVRLVASWLCLTNIFSPRLHDFASIVSQIRGIPGRRGRDDIVGARFREAILGLADPSTASTRCIEEIEAGHLQKWADMPAPAIAIEYWRLAPDAKLLDVIYAVRSDESTHRFVNHSLANLNPSKDVNPFAFREPDMFVKGTKLG